jgi:hypothetical protein
MDKHIRSTVEEVEGWNKDKLLKFIQQKRPHLLEDADDLFSFKAAKISGKFFLTLAGNMEFFEKKCHMPVGPSGELAELAREIAEREAAIKQGKLLSFIPYSKH